MTSEAGLDEPGVVVAEVSGELDAADNKLEAELQTLLARSESRIVVDLTNDTVQTITINGTEMGSWSAAAVAGSRAFLTDAVDGEIAIVTFSRNSNKQITQKSQIVDVQPGIQRLDVDTDQNLLIIVQSNGQVLIFDLNSNKVVADVNTD